VLHRHDLVNVYRPRQPSHKAQGTPLSRPVHPSELWCADYKGEFMLADRRYCHPLTVTDAASASSLRDIGPCMLATRLIPARGCGQSQSSRRL
jgi:hypothetical protein